ncbi:helix-turn-helix domain-containing protein [Rhodococcus erythropolis]|uniref:helix-turn-helix domain-containing protein n=1 Tax=Rhodococcus erythropolis TaxID=1833 RepID=UPI0037BC10F5
MSEIGVFWEDLQKDLEDPEFLRTFVLESLRIKSVDAIVNALDDAREKADLSKAELARAISAPPASIRRLLGNGPSNPTLGTVSEVAAALGYELVLKPLSETLTPLSEALVTGHVEKPVEFCAAMSEL